MGITHGDIKVIHCDFEQQMYDRTVFQYSLRHKAGASKLLNKENTFRILANWTYEVFDVDNQTRYGSYVSEQWFYLHYPNDNEDALRNDVVEILTTSLNLSNRKFNELKNILGLKTTPWDEPVFQEQDIQFVLSLLSKALRT